MAKTLFVAVVLLALVAGACAAGPNLDFPSGTFDSWTVEGPNTWSIGINPELYTNAGDPKRFVVNSYDKGEQNLGTLRSEPFTVEAISQEFSVSGWDGTPAAMNDGDKNYVLLRSYPDGEILRRAHTPGGNKLTPVKWYTPELRGRKVYVEVVDANPGNRSGGFAWIAFADYRQVDPAYTTPVDRPDLFGLSIDQNAEIAVCRSLPFSVANPRNTGKTTRVKSGGAVTIPVGAQAEAIYLLGMMNWEWDYGVEHWFGHPEFIEKRNDQVQIGSQIGEIEIRYSDATSDRVPLVMGATAWWVAQWAYGPTHGVSSPVREPFASRPEYSAVLARSLKLREDGANATSLTEFKHQYLAIKPRAKRIESIVVYDNPMLRGAPLVSAITLASAELAANKPANDRVGGFRAFGKWKGEAEDFAATVDSAKPGNWSKELWALSKVLYTSASDLPKDVKLIDFPKGLDAAKIRFTGGPIGDMLSNVWTQNLAQMHDKFEADTGYFHETGKTSPWYGGYSGIGTWSPAGVYHNGAYGRCSDHYATVALRNLNNPQRETAYVDFCDKWLYYYRANHDLDKGPANDALDITRYPKDAPPHWGMAVNVPTPDIRINEINGEEEMDGHAATMVGRWVAWRIMGASTGDWLTAPRKDVYGKSRWDATRDSADFICWFMDYTGRDVIYDEGETVGWSGGLVPNGMADETDPVKRKANYANANVYEPYPTYTCLTALKCSAQIADKMGQQELAKKWRVYADKLRTGMIRLLRVGHNGNYCWRESPMSVYPSFQDSLVQAWFSIYLDGLDPKRLDQTMTITSRNTLKRQLSQLYGFAPVLAMGYGQGWLTKSALILDDMDSGGKLLANIAKYSYDKNMDYADPARNIDWRQYLWLIPEGTNIMPDGRWYRIGDLTNGANQGPAMHALELCAGIDDTDPANLKIIPRAPKPLQGLEVSNFFTLVPDGDGLTRARVSYTFKRPASFSLTSDKPLPNLSVRLGPFDEAGAHRTMAALKTPAGTKTRVERSGKSDGKDAWWIWVEGMKDVRVLGL